MRVNKGFGFGLLFEMGCGKTITAIAIMGAGYNQKKVHKVLIVAPTSVCPVWANELEAYADFPCRTAILLGEKKKRLKQIQELKGDFSACLVAIINYESVWREEIFQALKQWRPDFIIADESQRIKNARAKQSKAMYELGDLAKYKLILTGTPISNHPLDLFGQYRFLDRTVFGGRFYRFRERYAIMGGFQNKEVVQYQNLDELTKKAYGIAFRITKEDALDLPEQVFINRFVSFSKKEETIYKKLCKQNIAELENGATISAPTVLTKLLRLQQFTGGFLPSDDDPTPELVFRGKLQALKEMLEDYVMEEKKKIVIFCRFRAEIDLIEKQLKHYQIPSIRIDGNVAMQERDSRVQAFQEDPAIMAAVLQISTAGVGITLTAAELCVYYSTTFSYTDYAQSLSRIHRIGQRNVCTYIHLIVQGTIDETILYALKKKQSIANLVIDKGWKQLFKIKKENKNYE